MAFVGYSLQGSHELSGAFRAFGVAERHPWISDVGPDKDITRLQPTQVVCGRFRLGDGLARQSRHDGGVRADADTLGVSHHAPGGCQVGGGFGGRVDASDAGQQVWIGCFHTDFDHGAARFRHFLEQGLVEMLRAGFALPGRVEPIGDQHIQQVLDAETLLGENGVPHHDAARAEGVGQPDHFCGDIGGGAGAVSSTLSDDISAEFADVVATPTAKNREQPVSLPGQQFPGRTRQIGGVTNEAGAVVLVGGNIPHPDDAGRRQGIAGQFGEGEFRIA